MYGKKKVALLCHVRMVKRCSLVLWKAAGRTILFAYLVLIFYVSYRLEDFYRTNNINSTQTTELERSYIPRCFNSVDELVNNTASKRWKLDIKCNKSQAEIIKHRVDQFGEPGRVIWKEDLECLKTFVKYTCYADKKHVVPNIVHYVWFGHREFKAETLVSVLSAVRFQQPCAILFHASELPFGPHWKVLLSLVPNIIHVAREEPSHIFGKKFGPIQHKSDIVRLEALKALGGIYLDTDQMLVRNVSEFMNSSLVMSHENKNNLANSMIIAQPEAPFLDLWYKEYHWYNPKKWGFHSTFLPWTLAKTHSNQIKVVGNLFVNPDYPHILKVWNGHYDISSNYGLHLYTRFYKKTTLNLLEVIKWNTTLGELWRTVLYDSPDLFNCSESNS